MKGIILIMLKQCTLSISSEKVYFENVLYLKIYIFVNFVRNVINHIRIFDNDR